MRPAPPLIALLCLWGLSGLAVLFAGVPLLAWQLGGAGLALLALGDALLLRGRETPQVAREIPDALPLGIEREVGLRIESMKPQRVEVFDLHPGAWPSQGLPRRLILGAATASRFSYRLRPVARGDATFDGVQL
ncbi:MAG TPA: DUF58 domain-containing protein, partial [Pseudoxanthomonas sp.]|nr:DUF58 domain-containing protein [Pseudoxanthomonas sp.]